MIKALIFDFNGVFVKEAPEILIHKSLGKKSMNFKLIELRWFFELCLVEKGKKPAIWLWKKIYPEKEKKNLLEKISEGYKKVVKSKEMFALCKKLKKNYEIYCLSNTNDLQAKAFKKRGFYKIFHETFLSTEMGYLKPMPKAFRKVLEKIKKKPNECLFIDDSSKNILAAKLLGFNTIKFNNFKDLTKKLNSFGIKV